jgi:hypothetical protein
VPVDHMGQEPRFLPRVTVWATCPTTISLGRLWAAVPVPVLRHVCPERVSVREPLHAPLAFVELREMLRPDVVEDAVWPVGAAPDSTRGVCVIHELCCVAVE